MLTALDLYRSNPNAVKTPTADALAYWDDQIRLVGYVSAKAAFDYVVNQISLEKVRSALIAKLTEAFSKQNIEIITGDGTYENFNFGTCAPNVAKVLMPFWEKYGRMPNLIFNDGVPVSMAGALKAFPNWDSPIRFYKYSNFDIWKGWDSWADAFPALSVAVKLHDGTVTPSRLYDSFASWNEYPLDTVEFGAAKTWQVLLLAYSYPDTLFATDEGIMVTPEGVNVLECSLPYFMSSISPGLLESESREFWGAGPFLFGVPKDIVFAAIGSYQKYEEFRDEQDKTTFMDVFSMLLSVISVYFAGLGFSGLMAGAFTIPNITGTLSLASKVGLDTGELGTALKLINLTQGDFSFDNSEITGGAMEDFGDFDGIDFSDAFDALDDYSLALDETNWGDVFDGVDFSDAGGFLNEWNADISATWSENLVESWGDLEAWVTDAGPVSAGQFSTIAGAIPAVTSAASAVLKASGASPTAPASPAQIQAAKTLAQSQATAATTPAAQTVWGQATQLLQLYGQYQLQAAQIERGVPLTRTSPTFANPVVRQPDGSVSVRNPDGTITTLRPNGSTGGLAALMTPQNLMIAGAVGVGFVALSMMRNRR